MVQALASTAEATDMATTDIFYFSGTGNSLFVARKLARSIEGARLSPFPDPREGSGDVLCPVPAGPEAVGFVFPVQFLALPRFIGRSIARMNFPKAEYFFAVATNGGDAGNALYDLDRLLRAKGKRLNYGLDLPMGDNSIVVSTSPELLERRLAAVDPAVESCARAALEGSDSPRAFERKISARLSGKMMEIALDAYYHAGEGHADPKLCSGCINRCPSSAVSLGRIRPSARRPRYLGPESIAD
jgi:hypothetical protein